MRFNSLQTRLTLLFTAFTLLVLISVGATVWGVETQRQDARVINSPYADLSKLGV
jgi:nitrate/nitrite-specific signal transduction histidine kinase